MGDEGGNSNMATAGIAGSGVLKITLGSDVDASMKLTKKADGSTSISFGSQANFKDLNVVGDLKFTGDVSGNVSYDTLKQQLVPTMGLTLNLSKEVAITADHQFGPGAGSTTVTVTIHLGG